MKKIISILNIVIVSILFVSKPAFSQNKKTFKIMTVGFYNCENLFDTIVDPDTNKILQDDFTPNGPHKWNSKRYHEKLQHLSTVLSDLGTEYTSDGPSVFGLVEVENKNVIADLINTGKLKKNNYKIVHTESPDKRGIDVAFVYNPKYYKVISHKAYNLVIPDKPDFRTRNQLLVNGVLDGDTIHFLINHWPSRRGGEKRSRPLRNAAAKLAKSIIDSILSVNKNAKVILMGDFNDDPTSPSMKKYMKAKEYKDINNDEMYNPMIKKFKKGFGSLAYRDNWNLFDQFLLTKSLLGKPDKSGYKYWKAEIYKKAFLINQDGRFKGYPFRTYVGDTYLGGYSDHLPVYMFLIKEG